MTSNPEKDALRKHLLEKRDAMSFEIMEIHAQKILSKLKKMKSFSEAKSICKEVGYPVLIKAAGGGGG